MGPGISTEILYLWNCYEQNYRQILIEELDLVLQDLMTKKLSGPLGITNKMLKNLDSQGKKYILLFLNKVINTGMISIDWITSYVLLLPKLKIGKDLWILSI